MEKISKVEWILDEFYYVKCDENRNHREYIFKNTSTRKVPSIMFGGVDCIDMSYDMTRTFYDSTQQDEECRIATSEERAWLEACMRANKLVERNEFKLSTYEIY